MATITFTHAMFCPVTRTVNTHDADELAILDFRILANSWQIRILFRWEGRVIPVSVLVLHVSGDDVDSHDCSCPGLSSVCFTSVVGLFAGAAESVFASFRVFRQLAFRNDFHVRDGRYDKLRYALSRRDFDGSFAGVVQDHA